MILIANTGNRNIRYRGLYYDARNPLFSNYPSFREFTRHLLENFEEEKEWIEPQILPELIAHLNEIPGHIILFYSESPEGVWNEQDTLHEAVILQKLFSVTWPETTTTLLPLKCRVTDTNGLMKRYRSHLRKILVTTPENEAFVLCDAGGTAQQKSALKIIFEYLLDDNRYRVFNVNLTAGKSTVEPIESVEFRRVINQEQIYALVKTGNYRGALAINNLNQQYKKSPLNAALNIAANLYELNLNRACTLSSENCFGKRIADWPVIASIGKQSFYGEPDNALLQAFNPEQIFTLKVTLDVARFCESSQLLGFAVLFHHIFIEQLLSFAIEHVLNVDIDNRQTWPGIKNKLINGEWAGQVQPPPGMQWEAVHTPSLPVKIAVAALVNLPVVQAMADTFRKVNTHYRLAAGINQPGLDSIRNKFAHEGRTISQDDYAPFRLVFKEWYALISLPDTTIFDQLNACIAKMLDE